MPNRPKASALRGLKDYYYSKGCMWGLEDARSQLALHPRGAALGYPRLEMDWGLESVRGQG